MIVYDKDEIKKELQLEEIFSLLEEWGGDPMYTDFGIVSATICHNEPGLGSKKLYYYQNSHLFYCYTGCDSSFDIFELVIKVFDIQQKKQISLYTAVKYIAARLGLAGQYAERQETKLIDWDILSNYDRIQKIEHKNKTEIILKEYDKEILNKFNYNLLIEPWIKDGIDQSIIKNAQIGYYLGGDQITIPHYDENNRLIGVRGRTMSKEEAELYGKYRPLKINKQLYSHPLGMNLYGLNWAKENLKFIKKAVVFESEKSVLQYQSHFGLDNSIAVAVCGSNLSAQQFQLLLKYGVEEIIIAFDKQYEKLNTTESKQWSTKMIKLRNKYKNDCLISFIWDKESVLQYKSSPTDEGKDKFLYLFKNRIII